MRLSLREGRVYAYGLFEEDSFGRLDRCNSRGLTLTGNDLPEGKLTLSGAQPTAI